MSDHMDHLVRKSVYVVSVKASLKPFSSATETSWKIEISPVLSLHMIFSKQRITKALISLHGYAGWSAPLLFTTIEDRFSRVAAHIQPFARECYILKLNLVKLLKLSIRSW